MVRCYVRTKTPVFITYCFPCLFVFFFLWDIDSLSPPYQLFCNWIKKMFGIVKNMCQRRDKLLKMSPVHSKGCHFKQRLCTSCRCFLGSDQVWQSLWIENTSAFPTNPGAVISPLGWGWHKEPNMPLSNLSLFPCFLPSQFFLTSSKWLVPTKLKPVLLSE